MIINTRLFRAFLLCGTGALVLAAPAAGQTESSDDDTARLDTIVVTSDKVSEKSVLDTAFSVRATSGESLERTGVDNISDVLAQNPGVTSFEAGGSTRVIQIRGVSSVIGDATVGFYLDDLPLSLVDFQTLPELNPYDLDRVEVLRGPQGTLYGASSQGGTIRILTQNPVHNEFSGKVSAGYFTIDGGGDENYTVQGAVNIPLIEDTLSARVVGSVKRQDGFIDLPLVGEEDYNEIEEETYRAKLRFTPTNNLEIGASYWGGRNEAGFNNATEDLDFFPNFFVFDFTGIPTGTIAVPGDVLFTETEFHLGNFNVTYDLGDFSIYSTTSYINYDASLPQNFTGVFIENDSTTESFNQETRISYDGGGRITGTAGFFYLDNESETVAGSGLFFDGAVPTVFTPPPVNTVIDSVASSEQWAIFGEVGFQLTEDLSVLGGVRYFEDDREAVERAASTVGLLGLGGIDPNRSEKFDATTLRANIAYTPTDSTLFYVNYAEGFRSGSSQSSLALATAQLQGVDAPLFTQPEDLMNIETGAKVSFLENRLSVQVAAYYLDWDDIITQLSVFSPITNSLVSFADNVGAAEGYGIDIEVVYQPIDSLTFTANANLNSTEYTDDLPAANIADGDQVAHVPDATLFVSADYSKPLTENMDGTISASYRYLDSRPDYAFGVPTAFSNETHNVDMRVGLVSENWSAYLTATNLLNEDDAVSEFAIFQASGIPGVRPRPRTLGVELNANF